MWGLPVSGDGPENGRLILPANTGGLSSTQPRLRHRPFSRRHKQAQRHSRTTTEASDRYKATHTSLALRGYKAHQIPLATPLPLHNWLQLRSIAPPYPWLQLRSIAPTFWLQLRSKSGATPNSTACAGQGESTHTVSVRIGGAFLLRVSVAVLLELTELASRSRCLVSVVTHTVSIHHVFS